MNLNLFRTNPANRICTQISRIVESAAVAVPFGLFKADIFTDFQRKAPLARYQGVDPSGRHLWTEIVVDPETGQAGTFAWSCNSIGKDGTAYLIDPDPRGHSYNIHEAHLFMDGKVCIDVAGVNRDIREVRALGILWWTLFLNFLATGEPIPVQRV